MNRNAVTIRKEATYPQPPEKVWVAITDPHAIAEWLMPNDFKPLVGHRFIFQTDPMPMCGDSITECEVLEVDPPRKLVYTWSVCAKKGRPAPEPTVVSFTLEPEGTGTRLIFEHIGVERIAWHHRFMMRFGWGTMVKRWIPKVADRVGQDGVFTPGAIPLAKRCYKCKTIPDHLAR